MTLATIILQILLTIPLTIILNNFQNKENKIGGTKEKGEILCRNDFT